jgi:hypothetical protein
MTTPGLIIGVWTDTPNINIDNDDEVDELLKKALVAKSDKFTVEEIGEWNV